MVWFETIDSGIVDDGGDGAARFETTDSSKLQNL